MSCAVLLRRNSDDQRPLVASSEYGFSKVVNVRNKISEEIMAKIPLQVLYNV